MSVIIKYIKFCPRVLASLCGYNIAKCVCVQWMIKHFFLAGPLAGIVQLYLATWRWRTFASTT